MTTHLYCVLPHASRGAIPPGLSGILGAKVRALPVDHLVAWVSDVERGLTVTVDGVRAHDAVVEAALGTGSTPIPARFGQRFDDDRACFDALSSRASSVETLLADVQGLFEMTVLITPSTNRMLRDLEPVVPEILDAGADGEGRRYLETLRAREEATGSLGNAMDALADHITVTAERFVRRWAVNKAGTPLPLRTLSHLIAREDLDGYRAAIDDVHTGPELRFLLVGPRAPYSFCALRASDGQHGMNLAD